MGTAIKGNEPAVSEHFGLTPKDPSNRSSSRQDKLGSYGASIKELSEVLGAEDPRLLAEALSRAEAAGVGGELLQEAREKLKELEGSSTPESKKLLSNEAGWGRMWLGFWMFFFLTFDCRGREWSCCPCRTASRIETCGSFEDGRAAIGFF